MVSFHLSFVDVWKTSGYKFIHVLARKKYGVLRPLFQEADVQKGYVIDITEVGLLQIKEDYFLIKEKNAPAPVLVTRAVLSRGLPTN